MEIPYDNHDKDYDEYLNDKNKSQIADSWLNIKTLDYWRHERMLNLIKPFITKSESWLTIGDGRYGSESSWLKRFGVTSHASDMNTNLLEVAHKRGYIDSYSKQNAENLNFKDESFDYILIKETLHHLPRPWLAVYEAYRVCKKGVIIIEPNDPFPYGSLSRIIFVKLKNLIKKIFKKNIYKEEYSFETVGNFIYTINKRELEKFLLGMHKTSIAFNDINDHYFKNVELISIESKTKKERLKCLYLKLIILIKDILCNFGFLKYSIGEVILFKSEPQIEILNKMSKYNWKYKKLPHNPYLYNE